MANDTTPLSVIMESARTELITAFNEAAQKSRLPAFLLEGIVEGLLADIRARKNAELAAEVKTVNEQKKEVEDNG